MSANTESEGLNWQDYWSSKYMDLWLISPLLVTIAPFIVPSSYANNCDTPILCKVSEDFAFVSLLIMVWPLEGVIPILDCLSYSITVGLN